MINSYNNYSYNYSYDIFIIVSDGNRTEWSNQAIDFKSAKGIELGQFEIMSTIFPELHDTKPCCQLIFNNKM